MTDPPSDTYSHLGIPEITVPTLVETGADRLRRAILDGHFAPGERLYEAALAREFEISRGPIREALALLEGDGLVENIPRRGKFVQRLDARTVDEIYSLRKVLEPYAAELLVESLSPETEKAIRGSLTEIYEAIASGDASQVAVRDIAFHAMTYKLTDHRLLIRAWDDIISNKLTMLVRITTKTHDTILDTGKNHEEIVNAIVSRDTDRCRLLLVEHIDDAWRRAKSALSEAEVAEVPTDKAGVQADK